MTTTIPRITLNNDVSIPQLGFGTFQIAPETTRAATLAALEVGYRHIDTAPMYRNELQVGQAVRKSGLDRSEVFVTSKLSNASHGHVATLEAFERTLDALDLGYLDLFLIHWPMPRHDDYVDTWQTMAHLYESGRVRSVGVSNFQSTIFDDYVDTWQTMAHLYESGRVRSVGVSNFQSTIFDDYSTLAAWCPPSTRLKCTRS